MSAFLRHDLGDGADLVLLDLDVADAMLELVLRDRQRLGRWEHWPHLEQSVERNRQYAREQLIAFAEGRALPLVVRDGGKPVGSLSARFDPWTANAEIGYWIDGAAEGRGLMTRAGLALVDELDARGTPRVEIRTSSHNARSRALAERLGFRLEGVLRAAHPVGAERHDLAVYGRLHP